MLLSAQEQRHSLQLPVLREQPTAQPAGTHGSEQPWAEANWKGRLASSPARMLSPGTSYPQAESCHCPVIQNSVLREGLFKVLLSLSKDGALSFPSL